MTCSAVTDRFDRSVMRCHGCGLFWDATDPVPPGCRASVANGESSTHECSTHECQARPHDYKKSELTRPP
jgi:hypothetical protein